MVLDGPDPASAAAIRQVADPRIRLLELPRNRGVAAARNAGLAAASGAWVALLDDDDEWHRDKLRRQLAAARASGFTLPLVACGFYRQEGQERVALPRRLPRPGEPLGDYLFTRESWFRDDGMLLLTTWLFPRQLAEMVPFDADDPLHEDWRWLLTAETTPGFGLVFLPEPLATWHTDRKRPRRSEFGDWQAALAWINSVRPLISARACAGYLCGVAAPRAAADRSLAAANAVTRALHASRAARARDWAQIAAIFLLPPSLRTGLRRAYDAVRALRGGAPAAPARSKTST